jgi:hypothetical protein
MFSYLNLSESSPSELVNETNSASEYPFVPEKSTVRTPPPTPYRPPLPPTPLQAPTQLHPPTPLHSQDEHKYLPLLRPPSVDLTRPPTPTLTTLSRPQLTHVREQQTRNSPSGVMLPPISALFNTANRSDRHADVESDRRGGNTQENTHSRKF